MFLSGPRNYSGVIAFRPPCTGRTHSREKKRERYTRHVHAHTDAETECRCGFDGTRADAPLQRAGICQFPLLRAPSIQFNATQSVNVTRNAAAYRCTTFHSETTLVPTGTSPLSVALVIGPVAIDRRLATVHQDITRIRRASGLAFTQILFFSCTWSTSIALPMDKCSSRVALLHNALEIITVGVRFTAPGALTKHTRCKCIFSGCWNGSWL